MPQSPAILPPNNLESHKNMPLKPPPKPEPKQLSEPKKIPAGKVTVINNSSVDDGLPTEDTDQLVDMTSLRWLFVAPPGFGKTEFFSLFPDCLMLACEEGHKFIKGKKIIIDTWADSQEAKDSDGNLHLPFTVAVGRIQDSERFQFIQIDTLDALVKKCIDHHIGKANQAHLSDLGEYGKGYDLGQNDPIRRSLNSIFVSGRGIGLITHQAVETKSFKKGPVSKKETTLPNGIHKIIFPQMDLIIHGEFGAVRDGQKYRDRIIRSEGSEDILAKNRGGVLPPAWICPLDLKKRIEQMQSFFDGSPTERKEAIDSAYEEYLEFYEEP